MAYTVFARKYRPQTFEELVGQEHVARTLANAITQDRVAHAFLFTGVRGVGKTTTARMLAKALNCEQGPTPTPCNQCDACRDITAGIDVDVQEIDGASNNSVEDVRRLQESLPFRPARDRFKVVIVDEVHMLSTGAFNALLKTLEEPPPHVKFIFATTEIRKVPVTVLSRCQRFDLKRVDPETLLAHLQEVCAQEGADVAEDGLKLIVRAAEGSVRDALSLLDQAIVQGAEGGATGAVVVRDMLGLADRARTFELFAAAVSGDGAGALSGLDAQHADGADPVVVMRDLLDHCHDVTRAKVLSDAARFTDAADHVARVRALAEATPMGHLSRAWQMLLRAYEEARMAPDPLAAAEMALLRLAHAAGLPPPEAAAKLLARGGASDAGVATAGGSAKGPSRRAPETPVSGGLPDAPSARLRVVGGEDAEAPPAAAEAVAEIVADDDRSPPADDPAAHPLRPRSPRAWGEVVALAAENRDIDLKWRLERDCRPVRVEPGRIVYQPTDDAPSALASRLARALKAWTGETWLVSAEPGARGGETIAEARAREAAEAHARALEDPLVAEAMALWPGAEIAAIRPARDADKTDAGRDAQDDAKEDQAP